MPRKKWTPHLVQKSLATTILPALYQTVGKPGELGVFLEVLRREMAGEGAALHIEEFAGARSGQVLVHTVGGIEAADSYQQYYASRNIWLEKGRHLFAPGAVVTSEMACPRGEFLKSEYYVDFLKPLGIGAAVSAVAGQQRTRRLLLTIFNSDRDPEFSAEEVSLFAGVLPQLSQVIDLNGILIEAQQIASSLMAGLAQLPDGVLLIDSERRILFCNPAATKIVEQHDILRVTSGRLEAGSPESQAELVAACEITDNAGRFPTTRRINLSSRNVKTSFVLTLRAVGKYQSAFESQVHWLAVVRCPVLADLPTDDHLMQMFGLTPAEARLAALLLDGFTLSEIAHTLSVSKNTLRVQLAAVFSKTGTRRQSDFIRTALLCMRMPPV